MRLVEDWKWIVVKGWQFRLNILAALLSGVEAWFSFVDPYTLPEWLPPGTFAVLAAVTAILANFFRVLAQIRPPVKDIEP
jgi:hypothetical protein